MDSKERTLVIYTNEMDQLKELLSHFNIKFDVVVGKDDGLAHYKAVSEDGVALKICPEHRYIPRGGPGLGGVWREFN